MGLLIFALFLAVPLIEIFGFIQIGGLIGIWPTLGVVILTAIAGSILLRHQGMSTLFQAQSKLNQGALPLDEVVDGLCLALAGALLLTPGFFTDFFGFLLFVPWFRRGFAQFVFKKFIQPNMTVAGSFQHTDQHTDPQGGPFAGPKGHKKDDGVVIDGDWEDVSSSADPQRSQKDGPPSSKSKGGSPWRN